MNLKISLIALAASATFATPTLADVTTFSGITTGSSFFNRLIEDLSSLSTTGTAVPYSAYSFTVNTTGSYSFLSTAGFDNFVFLYSGIFNRNQPLVGALKGNDDLITAWTSGFVYNLNAGATYTFVTTGFSNADLGAFSNTIGGPGTVTAVPEPSVLVSMLLGLAGVSAAVRRKAAA